MNRVRTRKEAMVGQATTIVNARIFDGIRRQRWTSVRFTGGVIVGLSEVSLAQDGDTIIDAEHGTLLPGLIDSHVHLVPGALEQSLTFGVTTVLDMFSRPDDAASARATADSRLDVADIRSAGFGATAPGGHPSTMYAPIPTLTEASQAEQFVVERIAEGSSYLKIISGVASLWPALHSTTIAALVSAAHDRGLLTVAHVSSVAGVDQVLPAGVDVIAHVPMDAELSDSLVRMIAEAGIAVVPTLSTIENTIDGAGGEAVANDQRLARYLGERSLRELTAVASARRVMPPYSRAENAVARLSQAGVTILAGTDAPNPGTFFGASLHRELELLVRCGLTTEQALAAATSEPARVFGLDDRGRIAVGLRADLLLLEADPLTEIAETRAIRQIWRAGVVHVRRTFVPNEAEVEKLEAFDARVAAAVEMVRNRRGGFGAR